jgi:hypothetical protein
MKKRNEGNENNVMKSIRNLPYHQTKRKLGQMQGIEATKNDTYCAKDIFNKRYTRAASN